jgi:hypothetical protein
MRVVFVLLLSVITSFGASEVLPSANDYRASSWTNAGIPGGIPYRSTIAVTLSSGATSGQIETAFNTTAASNEVVFLNAGTYSLSGDIKLTASGRTLRGATNSFGKPTTILNFGGSATGWGLIDMSKATYPAGDGSWPGVSSVNITAGLTKGSTSITVASGPTSFTVGQIFVIDANQDGTHVRANNSMQGTGSQYSRNGNRPTMQVCHCTNVSGTTIQFEPPILTDFFTDAGIDCEMYWWDDDYSETVRWSGIEDLIVIQDVAGGANNNIAIGPAAFCWARNIWSTNVANNGSGFDIKWTYGVEIADCFLSKHDNIGSGTYAYDFGVGGMFKLINSIASETPCMLALRGTSGGVIFGNYGTNFVYSVTSQLTETFMFHGSHNFAILIEANYTPKVISDYIHGDASYCTIHRNRLTGWETGKTADIHPVELQTNSLNFAILGNVLGTAGFHDGYESSKSIYDFSEDNGTATGSMTRKGNYNTFNGSIPAGESMGTDTNAYSYVFNSAPVWWGNRGWPWVKATSTGDSLDTIQATNQPAGFRFLMGSNVPSASVSGGGSPTPVQTGSIRGSLTIPKSGVTIR